MEGSKHYSIDDIEKIKKKVVANKNLLTTLNLGDSLEDYLYIKSEFEELKKRVSPVDALKKGVEQAQPEQKEEHGDEVANFSERLASLNQMVEEVLSTLNKMAVNEKKKEDAGSFVPPQSVTINEVNQPDNRVSYVMRQPSFNQLRNSTGHFTYKAKMEEPVLPLGNKNYVPSSHEQQRHFNHRYFQAIQTQPNHIYNGLYKNIQMKTSTTTHGSEASTLMPNSIEHQSRQPLFYKEHQSNYLNIFNSRRSQRDAQSGTPEVLFKEEVAKLTLEVPSKQETPALAPEVPSKKEIAAFTPEVVSTNEEIQSLAPEVPTMQQAQAPTLESQTVQAVESSVQEIPAEQAQVPRQESPTKHENLSTEQGLPTNQATQPLSLDEQINQLLAQEIPQFEPELIPEKNDAPEVDKKKQRMNMFFNFFRK